MASTLRLKDLHGHGVPITVRRAGMLIDRHAIQVRRGDGDDDGTYDVITVSPGLGSSVWRAMCVKSRFVGSLMVRDHFVHPFSISDNN